MSDHSDKSSNESSSSPPSEEDLLLNNALEEIRKKGIESSQQLKRKLEDDDERKWISNYQNKNQKCIDAIIKSKGEISRSNALRLGEYLGNAFSGVLSHDMNNLTPDSKLRRQAVAQLAMDCLANLNTALELPITMRSAVERKEEMLNTGAMCNSSCK